MEILVPNSTIKIKEKQVVDYGQRVLPSDSSKLELMRIIVISEDDFFIERDLGEGFSTLGEYSLKINELNIKNKGIGAGANGILGFGDLIATYKNAKSNLQIKQKAELLFVEYNEDEAENDTNKLNAVRQILKKNCSCFFGN